ncbi:MAG: trypsin-like peptidase domain-containing protein [Proteobacteria bacterium]|nr:trypsin-like peptidase domain-containing protein [Pseudomonadota bacterium]
MRLLLSIGVLMALSLPVLAETKVPDSEAEITLSFAPLVKSSAPAVVNIYASKVVAARRNPFADDPFFSQFFNFGPATPRVQNSLGSGVILREDGIVVSNYHVVGDADEIRVALADRREFDARVILADPAADLAVLQLDGAEGLPALALADSDKAAVGDLVLAIGNPFGVGQTVTSGIVSGLARAGASLGRGTGYFIQTDAAINPGNSGGALVDMSGALLGINTSILSRSGGSMGIGFAIPSNLVAQYVAQAEAGATEIARPWPGIEVQPVDADMAEAMGMDGPHGVAVTYIHPESPFAAAGMTAGDVLTEIGGQPVEGPQELAYRLAVHALGDEVPVVFWQGGEKREGEVTLIAAPGSDATKPVTMGPGSIFEGLAIADLNPALIERLGLPLSAGGVAVTGVAGQARRTGLQPGDILTGLNGQPVRNAGDFAQVVGEGAGGWDLDLIRDGQRATARLPGG